MNWKKINFFPHLHRPFNSHTSTGWGELTIPLRKNKFKSANTVPRTPSEMALFLLQTPQKYSKLISMGPNLIHREGGCDFEVEWPHKLNGYMTTSASAFLLLLLAFSLQKTLKQGSYQQWQLSMVLWWYMFQMTPVRSLEFFTSYKILSIIVSLFIQKYFLQAEDILT